MRSARVVQAREEQKSTQGEVGLAGSIVGLCQTPQRIPRLLTISFTHERRELGNGGGIVAFLQCPVCFGNALRPAL